MDLHPRKRYTALDDDDQPLSDVPVEILDKQEQREQVQQLVAMAEASTQLYRTIVSVLQGLLILVLLVLKETPTTLSQILQMTMLELSMLRSFVLIDLDRISPLVHPILNEIRFNLVLLGPLVLHALYLYSASSTSLDLQQGGYYTSRQFFVYGLAPVIAILLRLGTEWEGQRTLREAKSLEKLMYDSPEA